MKNKFFKVSFFIIILIVIIISCRKEIVDKLDFKAADINEAQTWYQKNKPPEVGIMSEFSKGDRINMMPDWESAYISDHKEFKSVETEVSIQGRVGFVSAKGKDAFEQTGNFNYMVSHTKMVILTDKKSKISIGFLMTLIPDKDYLDSTEFNAYSSKYVNMQKGFSGYVFYHTLKGDFNNGWKYLNGEIVKKVKKYLTKPNESFSKYEVCWTLDFVNWYQRCWKWFKGPASNPIYYYTTCDQPFIMSTGQLTVCSYIADDSSLQDGGGFDENALPPDENRPCPGDPIKNIAIAPTSSNGSPSTGMPGCNRVSEYNDCDSLKRNHLGVDIACDPGTPIYSMQQGIVLAICNTFEANQGGAGWGNYVTVRYTNISGSTTDITYAHLNYVSVAVNATIKIGQIIGQSGKTGNAFNVPNPHVHIQVSQDGEYAHPSGYFGSLITDGGIVISPCTSQ